MTILVYPLNENPYQKMLYQSMSQIDSAVNINFINQLNLNNRTLFVRDVFNWPIKLMSYKDNKKILHIHWQFFYFLVNKRIRAFPTILLTIWCLGWAKLLNYKIIWTVHDYSQHEIEVGLDNIVRRIMIIFSSRIIVLNSDTKSKLYKYDKVKLEKLTLIPIGNYGSDMYYVHNKGKHFTYVFFGLIRKYKGVSRLISAFSRIKNSDIRLKIVGDCYDKMYFNELRSLAVVDNRIEIKDQFLTDSELSEIIHKADVTVLPFLEITNSSSALLSYAKGRPVIAPDLGSFKDNPSNIRFSYSNNTEDALLETMIAAYDRKDETPMMGKLALNFSRSLDWKEIAKRTLKLYTEVLN